MPPEHDYRQLRQFASLARLSDDQLILLAARAEYRDFRAGQVIAEPANVDGRDFFLLRGAVSLVASDGSESRIEADSPEAASPLNHVEPLPHLVRADEPCQCLVVGKDVLTQLLRGAPLGQAEKVPQAGEEGDEFSLLMEFYADLRANKLPLPSLPDVALRVRRVTELSASSAEDVGRVINADPAISVKLIRACNSPLYRGFSEVATIRDAVVRLGLHTTRQLVTVFAMRELFRSQRTELQKTMTRLWDHSREVAAISWALARALPGVDAEAALLAGLLHDIGVIPVLHYADHYVNLFADYRQLDNTIASLRGEIGQAVLSHWGFSPAYLEVVQHAEDWFYDSGETGIQLVDLVIVAQLHAFIGKAQAYSRQLPVFDEVPAFRHMRGLELTPERSLRVLTEAREQMGELRALLSGRF